MAAIVTGSLSLTISDDCDDHHSFMELLKDALVGEGKWMNGHEPEGEFWDMLQETILFECPKQYRWESLQAALDACNREADALSGTRLAGIVLRSQEVAECG